MKKVFRTDTFLSFTSNNHLTSAFSGGILGFFLFFLIIMIVKTISFEFGIISQFKVESEDILLSIIGLVLMALIKLLEELRLKEPLS